MQDQKNNITEAMIIGGFVRLALALPTPSFVSPTEAIGPTTVRATLVESLQLSELHKQCRCGKL